MQYKLKHRLSAAFMAGAMCCTMIPAASAEEIATPETAEAAVTEVSNEVEHIHRCVRCNKKCLGGLQQHQGTHCIYEKG